MYIKTIITVLTAALIIGWFSFKEPTKTTHNVFSSQIYPEYRFKIKNFILNHPSNSLQNDALLNELTHESFVQKLREILENKPSPLFVDLVNSLFLEVNLKSELQNFLYSYVKKPNKDDFLTYLQETRKILAENPKFCGQHDRQSFEDQFLTGNLPSFVANISNQTKLIRMGQPICQTPYTFWWMGYFKPSPEFLLFIRSQPHHLYVNLMKRKGLEAPLTMSLESLEHEHKNLYVVTLDKNSSFYWQNDPEYPEILETLKFKQIFLDKLSQSDGNYFWSTHLDLPSWKEELNALLNQVHLLTFNNETSLNRQERQDFIEITYLAILDRLTNKWNPTSMNITCRQGMDRAPSLMVLWMLQKGISNKEELASLLLGAPLVIHNRASHSSRIDRFISAAKRIGRNL